jgi:exodeoxyribonuclease VII large subunit
VWAFAPVQDRHAAPAVARALMDLAACPEVEVIIVARGGGSLADLFAFCDETLARTVALLPVPVIASVGHHTDRTLLDDVAAVSCSTPTHAAEAAVPVDCAQARAQLLAMGRRLSVQSRRAVLERARGLVRLARAPAEHVVRHRRRLHQETREMRASTRRRLTDERALARRRLLVLERKASAATSAGVRERARDLERLRLALDAHDPERTLERGFALVEDDGGEPVTGADRARKLGRFTIRFADGRVRARRDDQERLF